MLLFVMVSCVTLTSMLIEIVSAVPMSLKRLVLTPGLSDSDHVAKVPGSLSSSSAITACEFRRCAGIRIRRPLTMASASS